VQLAGHIIKRGQNGSSLTQKKIRNIQWNAASAITLFTARSRNR
jgi:hypothetical protein